MQTSFEHENAKTGLIFGIFNSASVFITPVSYWSALNKSSILLIILSLCIKLVLTKDYGPLLMPLPPAELQT